MTELPLGFACHVANIGVKDSTDDFVVITASQPVAAAGVFTKSRFCGPSVTISRTNVADHRAQSIVVVSKNANVANGPDGERDALELVAGVAARLGCSPQDVLVASTGVIGRRYPMDTVRAGIAALPSTPTNRSADAVARGIMTTDTVPKIATQTVPGEDGATAPISIVGIAKGVGMIEPNMATMIAIILTDANIAPHDLDAVFRRVVDRSFNCVSIDTDTSTSDTAVILASGAAGSVDPEVFETALTSVCTDLTKQIARDGEGAEKLIEVTVDQARDSAQAKRVAKSIVNSPLVKTAVHGADPNWGRVAMAVGKCSDDTDIDQDKVTIRFAGTEVYPRQLDESGLTQLTEILRRDTVEIGVSLNTGDAAATVWGCDLTDGYIRINADYTT